LGIHVVGVDLHLRSSSPLFLRQASLLARCRRLGQVRGVGGGGGGGRALSACPGTFTKRLCTPLRPAARAHSCRRENVYILTPVECLPNQQSPRKRVRDVGKPQNQRRPRKQRSTAARRQIRSSVSDVARICAHLLSTSLVSAAVCPSAATQLNFEVC